jgi:transcription antitermination protein NusB
MGTRREAREWAVQILFQLDLNPTEKLDGVFTHFWDFVKSDRRGRTFTEELVRGVVANHKRIDGVMAKHAENWDVDRMSVLDRNVLRMALFEMLFRPDIPPVVSIDEAVEIAKHFSNAESGRFVNGVLDKARRELDRPSRTSTPIVETVKVP